MYALDIQAKRISIFSYETLFLACKFSCDLFIGTELDVISERLYPSQESLNHTDYVRHPACVWMKDESKDCHVFPAICDFTLQPLETIHPHAFDQANVDKAL